MRPYLPRHITLVGLSQRPGSVWTVLGWPLEGWVGGWSGFGCFGDEAWEAGSSVDVQYSTYIP